MVLADGQDSQGKPGERLGVSPLLLRFTTR